MLSICVPVYNFDIGKLIADLSIQINNNKIEAEIILIDDASGDEFRQTNIAHSEKYGIRYIQLAKNIGRSAIRNLFLKYCVNDYLLFLDCDSELTNDKFIENYIRQISNGHKLICGGRSYDNGLTKKTHALRKKYGIARESVSANRRNISPYKSFMTNNFVVHKKVLSKIRFDERLTQYGHEDTLFGYRLKQHGIAIMHINNPVLHDYNESNLEFLKKTEAGLKSLAKIHMFINDKNFDKELKILRVYTKVEQLRMTFLCKASYRVLASFIRRLISINIGGLFLLDIYKLLFLCGQIKYLQKTKQ